MTTPFVSWAGLGSEHLTMCKNGMWKVASDFLGNEPRAVNPHHVTYVRSPMMDDPQAGWWAIAPTGSRTFRLR